MKKGIIYVIFAILAIAILYGITKLGSIVEWLFKMFNL